ncbi:atrial natriuretic peptide receptor 3 isoform X2 [Electrophorus electricus]|uniref:atrial natriuretic peptide receptor 3 isoform X2 n=1 Tax=Electrophorus electricus TaxID=8005 RepID=UPI000F09B5AA|nr:atrial natriuretic peptide receptor 3 isoform X2 [Electrophorus electricus]
MLYFPYLCISIWVLGFPVRTSALNENVDVLVLLPQNSSYIFSISRVSPAIEYARQQLANGHFAGLNFNFQYVSSECGVDALFALVDRAPDERPDLIFGPVCEYAAAPVVRVASHWNIPVMSAGALAYGFINKNSEFSLLTRTAPSYMKMAETFAVMSQHFGWRSVLLIYHDDKEERNCYFTVEGVHVLLEDDHDISVFVMDSREPLTYVDELIKPMYEHEVVIMCTYADVVREIMLNAHRRRLTTSNRLFFNIELFNSSSYGDGSWRRGDRYDNEAKAAYAFLNTVTLLRSTKPEFENFSMEMRKSYQKMGVDVCEINMFMEGFHDALLLYALALDDAMKSGYTKKNGKEITQRMWNRTFEGIAGQVSMDANGDRNGDFSVISMTNHETGSHETVMSYFGTNGSLQINPDFDPKLFTVQGAPGPPSSQPTDQSCGLGLSAVTGIIVGGLLGTALLMAFYFFRKNYRITIERRTQREQCDGKHRQLREDSIRSNFSAA